MKYEEVIKASWLNDELRNCWQSALAIHVSLHERLVASETSAQSRISSDPEVIMKTDDESELLPELAAYAARESQWHEELMRMKAELN